MKKLLVGSRNRGKIRELNKMISDLSLKVMGLSDLEGPPVVIEDRETLPGNAKKKARTFHTYSGLPTVSDDSGLEVEALNGMPGVKTARFAGEDATTEENINKLLKVMSGIKNRRARFRTVLAFHPKNGEMRTFEGSVEGFITLDRRGENGFGYDPVFTPTGKRTFAEMSKSEKDQYSHRRDAFEQFKNFIK